MNFQPSGRLYLCEGVPIDKTYQHTIDFSTTEQQNVWFQQKVKFKFDETGDGCFTYIRKDHTIKVPIYYEKLYSINYCMYRNGADKWVYCFVNQIEYVNDETSLLYVETDVMQTYWFDFHFKPSFIDREHQDRWNVDGTPRLNFVAENLDYGDEYVQKYSTEVRGLDVLWFLAISTEPIEDTQGATHLTPEPIQMSPTPLHYYLFPYAPSVSWWYDGAGRTLMSAQDLCRLLSENISIVSVSYIPYLPIDYTINGTTITCNNGEFDSVYYSWNNGQSHLDILKLVGNNTYNSKKKELGTVERYAGKTLPSTFDLGVPRSYEYETKLLTYPYYYWHLTDYQETPMVIKNEYMNGDFVVWCTQTMSHNPKTKYFIENYKGNYNTLNEMGKTESCINSTVNDLPLKTDAYKNYMQMHKASATTGIALNLAGAAVSLGVGAATGGLGLAFTAGTAMSSISAIAMEMAKRKDLQNTPDSLRAAGNNISFDIADGNLYLKLVRFEIAETYRRIIGDFFALYGYKCNEVKTPNLRSRYYYNYIKTIGANIYGEVDGFDLVKIKAIFDSGVTIWHFHESWFDPMNYDYDNVEVSLVGEGG